MGSVAFNRLARQAAWRFVAVFAAIGGLSTLMLGLAWFSLNDTFQREQSQTGLAALQSRLGHRLAEWQREADALATQIGYTRMLESAGPARWDHLRAYINALGENFLFDTLIVADNRGKPVFFHGEEAQELEGGANTIQAGWYTSTRYRHTHRILETPVWLGPDGGQGRLFLLKVIDNRLMADLAGPGIRLALAVDEKIFASSRGTADLGQPVQLAGLDVPGQTHQTLALHEPGILLHIWQALPQALSPWQFALAGTLLSALLGLALLVVFGRWLRRLVRRVRTLSLAADLFCRGHVLDDETRSALERGGSGDDEIGTLQSRLRELMHSSQAREEESRAYLQTLEMLEEAVVELDGTGRLLRASPAWQGIVGLDSAYLTECFDPDDGENLRRQLAKLFSGEKELVNLRLRLAAPQRSGAWMECRFVPVDKPPTRVRGVLRDITQTYLQEKHITHMALHDALTGLPNRVLLEDRLKVALRLAGRSHSRVGVGFIDLDHFKNINDALGHKAGDQLLKAFADNLQQALRNGDTLARWGGDEFVVMLPDMHDLEDIRRVGDKLARVSREAVQIESHSLPVTFSMGFTVFPDDGRDVDVLLSQADRAMFYAKSQGRNMVQFFSDMTRKGLGKKELYIQGRLAAAIAAGAIETWFQPLVDAATGQPRGVEALARWHDPDLGWVSPATFIPMAENLGLIAELGDRVIAATLGFARSLLDEGHDLLFAVNISKRQLFMANCMERLLLESSNAGVDPGRLMLEVTESLAMSEVDYAEVRLRDLHEAGFKLAVDDFGVGYSSLSQLHEMPVDELKIDISFVRRAADPQGLRLIQAIVAMAQALRLTIVAEGVENEDTAALLAGLGVHVFQGFHFAKPMPAGECGEWLRQRLAG